MGAYGDATRHAGLCDAGREPAERGVCFVWRRTSSIPNPTRIVGRAVGGAGRRIGIRSVICSVVRVRGNAAAPTG